MGVFRTLCDVDAAPSGITHSGGIASSNERWIFGQGYDCNR